MAALVTTCTICNWFQGRDCCSRTNGPSASLFLPLSPSSRSRRCSRCSRCLRLNTSPSCVPAAAPSAAAPGPSSVAPPAVAAVAAAASEASAASSDSASYSAFPARAKFRVCFSSFSLSLAFQGLFIFSFIRHCARTRAGVAFSRVSLSPASAAAMVRGDKASAIWDALRVGDGLSELVLIGWRLVPHYCFMPLQSQGELRVGILVIFWRERERKRKAS